MPDSPEVVVPEVVEKTTASHSLLIPEGFPDEVFMKVKRELEPQPQRGLVFEDRKRRNTAFMQKGVTKPGKISYETLRRAANSVHVARICINVLKAKVTKTQWVIKSRDATKDADEKKVEEVKQLLDYPNRNSETFRSLMDKIIDDLLTLDAVSIEKTRYPNGKLAELYFVDSATVRPVFDELGNQDVEIPLKTKKEGETEMLPVSYIQVLENSQYGGPESGEIVAAWPKKDFIHFHMHPQGAMDSVGYGLSPLEGVLSVVANLLNADNYNSTYFEEGSFPPILLHYTGQISQRDLEAYREYLVQELTGNFHRPAITAGAAKPEVIDLKSDSNRDMQFMEYTEFLAKLMCAAMGLSPQDIGLTDDVNRSTSETMADLSNQKGYSSILDLIASVINSEIIWKDFGYTELEFEWVAQDNIEPKDAATIYDTALKNGSLTLNEVREKNGQTPFDKWADDPMILTPDGYKPLLATETDDEEIEPGEEPYQDEQTEDIEGTPMKKSRRLVSMEKGWLTNDGYKTWMDDRGYSQPFIYMDIRTGAGMVFKPPIAVNLQSQELEKSLTRELAARGLNVKPMREMTYVEVMNLLSGWPEVLEQFLRYIRMEPEYDSQKWRGKFGGSRKFDYYLTSDYIDGYNLSNPLLLADMERDPESYMRAIDDLAALWKVEKEMVLGDRRADQYIVDRNKRAWGIDYQFKGDKDRWNKTKDALPDVLRKVPELIARFEAKRGERKKSITSTIKKAFGGI